MAKRKPVESEDPGARLIDRDLTALAREGRLPAAYGVDETVAEVLSLLARPDKHPLLAGDPGVGKTAIVQEAVRRIVEGKADASLSAVRVVEVSIAGILARGERKAAETLDELFEQLGRTSTVVYLRDAVLGLGGPTMPVIIRALRSGLSRFVLEADPRRANDLLRSDETLAERLHLLVVHEPPIDRARWVLGKVADDLETELGVPIDPAACDLAIRISSKFLLAQRMPRKAIELLRETAAEVSGGRARTAAESSVGVGPEDVLSRFCSATRLPRFVVDDTVPLDLVETARFFGERILGQSDAVQAVLRSVALLKAGLNDPRRPLGVFLFGGPTGVGKTHLAKLLAEFLFGSADRLVRLNMSDYANEGQETIPFGAPWGATFDQKRGELTRMLDGKVFAVLLLDEFEKAHRSVHDRFLQLFDEGRLINAAGETIPCGNVLIVATSNVGAEVYREPPIGFAGARSAGDQIAEVDRRIAEAFRPEFLNRFDAICHFQPLSKTEIRKIAHREVGRVLEREGIRARGLDVEVAPEVVDLLVERGYSPRFGARFLQREIEKTLTSALAVEIVRRPLAPGTPVRVEARPGGRVVAVTEALAQPRPATAQVTLHAPGAGTVKRKLDRRSLLEEGDALLRRAKRLGAVAGRSELEARRAELLAESQAPNFWDDPERAARALRDYRAADAQVGDLDRVVRECHFAQRRVREAKSDQHLLSAARAVEQVAREVQLLEVRAVAGSSTGVDEALLELEAAVDTPAAKAWVSELGSMYLSWAERRGYEGVAVAEGTAPARWVLRIAGPGALGYLAGEAGLHRRIEDNDRVTAYVRTRRWEANDAPSEIIVEGREVKRRSGAFLERVGAEATAKDEATGRALFLLGRDAPEIRHVARLLLESPAAAGAEVRRYFVGRGARIEDPRTGVSTPRIKDVMRGELEMFIAAWVSRDGGAKNSQA